MSMAYEENMPRITPCLFVVLFLPPYSLDLNPIEELFSKVKTALRSAEFDMAHITALQTLYFLLFSVSHL